MPRKQRSRARCWGFYASAYGTSRQDQQDSKEKWVSHSKGTITNKEKKGFEEEEWGRHTNINGAGAKQLGLGTFGGEDDDRCTVQWLTGSLLLANSLGQICTTPRNRRPGR